MRTRQASFAQMAIVSYLAKMLNINNYWLLVMIKPKLYNLGEKSLLQMGLNKNRFCFISNTLPDVFLMTFPNASCLSAIDWMLLTLSVMVLGGGALGKWFCHEDGALNNEISALKKRDTRELHSLLSCEDKHKIYPFMNQKQTITRHWIC